MPQFDRSELVSLAELSFQNGLFNDVITYMKQVIKMGTPLNCDERQIIFWSYIELKRPFYDVLDSYKDLNLSDNVRRELKTKAKEEINRIRDEVIKLLESYWVKGDDSNEAVTDYKTYLAVQHRHKASCGPEEDKENQISLAMKLHEEALKIGESLNPAHPVRLDNAYYLSLFYYNSLGLEDKAAALATEAREKGLSNLADLPEELRHHAEEILECMQEDFDKWI